MASKKAWQNRGLIGVLAAATLLLLSCAEKKQAKAPQAEEETLVRLMKFRVPPAQEEAWMGAVKRLAGAAAASKAEGVWLLHRSGAGDYFLVTFGTLRELQQRDSLVGGFAGHDVRGFPDELEALHSSGYEVVSDEVWKKVRAWSTVDDMSSTTHPGVDQRSYWVRPGGHAAVDAALGEMAALLTEQKYPYPTEGFRGVLGSDGTVQLITFFGERERYYGSGEPRAFLEARGLIQRWRDFEARMAEATSRSDRREARYLEGASYDSWEPEPASVSK